MKLLLNVKTFGSGGNWETLVPGYHKQQEYRKLLLDNDVAFTAMIIILIVCLLTVEEPYFD
jgi:hypothetical protein